jgi:peptide/nickel transport system permease protein
LNKLQRFIIKRLVITIFLAVAAVSVIFVILRLMPGTPYSSLLLSNQLQPEQVEALKAQYGLDQPLYIQYLNYVVSLMTLDFGFSIKSGKPVWEVLQPKLVNSLVLLIPALVFTAIVSSLIGMYAGWKRGSVLERASILLGTTFRSTPIFITGIFLLMIFAYQLGLFPVFGMRNPVASPETWQERFLSLDFLHHYILPFLTAALVVSGDFLLLARNGVVEKKGSAFLKLHKAKGLTEGEQLLRAGRNSMLPLVTYFAVRMGMIFQGMILLEVVFAWPGIGRQLVISIIDQDYPTVQAAVFLMALSVILANLAADVLYGYFDPTINVGDETA